MSEQKNEKAQFSMWWLLSLPLFIALPIGLYIYKFHGELSSKQDIWGQFGDFIGGTINPIVSALTLIAVIITYRWQVKESLESSKRGDFQMFESTFFKIIDIHYQKIENMQHGTVDGVAVFPFLLNQFNRQVLIEMKQKSATEKNETCRALIKQWLSDNRFESVSNYKEECKAATMNCSDDDFLDIIETTLSKYDMNLLHVITSITLQKTIHEEAFEKLPQDQMANLYRNASNSLYSEFGHIYGHYYRNMSMLFDHLSSFDNGLAARKFGKMFRAQLSKYEVALLFINNKSDKCSDSFRQACENYLLFDDLELFDIFGLTKKYDLYS